ncbi:MAG: tetratricopeptide repeat protein [Crocinitomicaceae bacterium]|nr:MAG: tetratricopeptide repeat protein [Crocinitomicaceae bacterium]
MKQVVLIGCFLAVGFVGFSQVWRDSLKEARKYFLNKEYSKSYAKYQLAQKYAPSEIDLSLEIAQAAYKAGKFQQAENLFSTRKSKTEVSTEKGKLNRLIGNAQMKQKQYQKAIQSYKRALRVNPTDDAARYNLAQALRQLQTEKKQEKNAPQKSAPQPPHSNQKQNSSNTVPPSNPTRSNQKKQEGTARQEKSDLSPEKTERLLDELMKKEIATKKKFEGMRAATGNNSKSRKDW